MTATRRRMMIVGSQAVLWLLSGCIGAAQADLACESATPSPVLEPYHLLSSANAVPLVESPSNYEVLKRADEARGNVRGVRWNVRVSSVDEEVMALTVNARGYDILAETSEPAKNRGDTVIMLNGNMWFHKPGLSKPIPISKRQKLVGDAAYGDIATTNYADDYDATRLEDETVDGRPCFVFELKATSNRATYDLIRYWVDKERLVGIKAEYFTKSGKLFKSARMRYSHSVVLGGASRPFLSEIDIQDELLSENKTKLTLNDPEIMALPDHLFNLNLLR